MDECMMIIRLSMLDRFCFFSFWIRRIIWGHIQHNFTYTVNNESLKVRLLYSRTYSCHPSSKLHSLHDRHYFGSLRSLKSSSHLSCCTIHITENRPTLYHPFSMLFHSKMISPVSLLDRQIWLIRYCWVFGFSPWGNQWSWSSRRWWHRPPGKRLEWRRR